eukprot:12575177-Alexandrium_andersonii.AAC.1
MLWGAPATLNSRPGKSNSTLSASLARRLALVPAVELISESRRSRTKAAQIKSLRGPPAGHGVARYLNPK